MKSLYEIVNEVKRSGKEYKGELPRGVKAVVSSKTFFNFPTKRKEKAPFPVVVIKFLEPPGCRHLSFCS